MNNIDNLVKLLNSCRDLVSVEWLEIHQGLFVREHLHKLATVLLQFCVNGVPDTFPQPHFNVECTPPLKDSYAYFQKVVGEFYNKVPNETTFANCLETIPIKNILILLGQRLTPASVVDANAIPPTKKELLDTALREEKQNLSVAARAWSKHIGRHPDNFWGDIKGNAAEKNAKAEKIIRLILNNTTWWNIFFHYKHELVYEIRGKTGHGIRWGKKGKSFIGFLEPFLEEEI